MKNIKGRALLISPYLDILGGGEKHILSILEIFDSLGYQCNIVWHGSHIMKDFNKKLGVFFTNTDIVTQPLPSSAYQYCIYVTDGSYFFSKAVHKYVFFMYPKKALLPLSFANRLKTRGWHFFANGAFTSKKIAAIMKKDIAVIHPYIDDRYYMKGQKEKIILSVGRFFPHLHSKRQDILIKAFTALQKKHRRFLNYRLILAGGLKNAQEDQKYFEMLQELKGSNDAIFFKTNISQKELLSLYAQAEIYWHATGYGLDEDENVEGVEHMGITPLEAMAAGCVVMCHNSGGPRRTIQSGINGFLYDTIEQLVGQTAALTQPHKAAVTESAQEYVKTNFSRTVFEKKVKEYFGL